MPAARQRNPQRGSQTSEKPAESTEQVARSSSSNISVIAFLNSFLFRTDKGGRKRYDVRVVVGLAVALLLFMGGVVFFLSGTSRTKVLSLTASNEDMMRDVFLSGAPWLVHCSDSSEGTPSVFTDAMRVLYQHGFWFGKIDCSEKLPSGKTIYERFSLKKGGGKPVVAVTGNGRKAKQVPSKSLKSATSLISFAQSFAQVRLVPVSRQSDFEQACLSKPTCAAVVTNDALTPSQTKLITKAMKAHRKTPFVLINTKTTKAKFDHPKLSASVLADSSEPVIVVIGKADSAALPRDSASTSSDDGDGNGDAISKQASSASSFVIARHFSLPAIKQALAKSVSGDGELGETPWVSQRGRQAKKQKGSRLRQPDEGPSKNGRGAVPNIRVKDSSTAGHGTSHQAGEPDPGMDSLTAAERQARREIEKRKRMEAEAQQLIQEIDDEEYDHDDGYDGEEYGGVESDDIGANEADHVAIDGDDFDLLLEDFKDALDSADDTELDGE